MKAGFKTAWGLLRRAVSDWNADHVSTFAAAVSYYTAFSIAPLLVIAVAVAGLAFGEQAASGRITGQLQQLIGPNGARAIETMMANARKPAAGIAANVIGIAVLLAGASAVFQQLRQSLNWIWKVESSRTAGVMGFVRGRLLSFGMVLAIGFILLVSLVLSTGIAAVGGRLEQHWPGAQVILHLSSSLVSFAIITVLFAAIFKILPDAVIEWRDVWLGSALSAFLFVIGKLAIGFYLGRSSVASSYGATASLGIVLLWVYYSAQLLLFGAEFTHVFARWRTTERPGIVRAAPEKPKRSKGRPWYRHRWIWGVGAVLVVCGGVRAALDPVATRIVRQKLSALHGYVPDFDRLHVSLHSLSTTLTRFKLVDAAAPEGAPDSFYAQGIEAHLLWKDLLRAGSTPRCRSGIRRSRCRTTQTGTAPCRTSRTSSPRWTT